MRFLAEMAPQGKVVPAVSLAVVTFCHMLGAATRVNMASTELALVAALASSTSVLRYLRERRSRDCRKVHPIHPFDVPIRFTLHFPQKVETQSSAGAQTF